MHVDSVCPEYGQYRVGEDSAVSVLAGRVDSRGDLTAGGQTHLGASLLSVFTWCWLFLIPYLGLSSGAPVGGLTM